MISVTGGTTMLCRVLPPGFWQAAQQAPQGLQWRQHHAPAAADVR